MPRDLKSATAAVTTRYAALDGLRGVAALFVVARHIGPYVPRFSYLAVDLFFVLSGFVLALQNDARFEAGLSPSTFLRGRIRRLYPLYALGLAMGLVSALVANPGHFGLPTILGSTGWEALGLPSFTNLWTGGTPFPVDGVLWSIFFEFWVANLAFALLWRRLQGGALIVLILVCGAALVGAEAVFHTLDVGWTWSALPFGVARVGYAFFLGVALCRLHRRRPPRWRAPGWAPLAILAALLSLPLDGAAAQLAELVIVLAIFPALIFWSATARERRPALGRLLGDTSYAAYALHRPLAELAVWALPLIPIAWGAPPAELAAAGQIGFVAAMVALAWAADRYFDAPVRRSWAAAGRRSTPVQPSAMPEAAGR